MGVELLCAILQIFTLAVFARIILSYFPLSPNSAMASIYSVLYRVTEPVMGPLRRLIPSIGMFDISPIVVFIGLQILQAAVCGG